MNIKSYAKFLVLFGAVLTANTWLATPLLAQDCSELASNEEFTSLLNQMNAQVKEEAYPAALKTVQRLIEICPTVPSVNYVAGKIYQKMDNIPMAHSYYRVATENTKLYAVDPNLMKEMWYARYETEFPEVIDFKTGKFEDLHQKALA